MVMTTVAMKDGQAEMCRTATEKADMCVKVQCTLQTRAAIIVLLHLHQASAWGCVSAPRDLQMALSRWWVPHRHVLRASDLYMYSATSRVLGAAGALDDVTGWPYALCPLWRE